MVDGQMKVAIIHYWLVGMRGGEKVVEALCKIFPNADIFTHVYVEEAISPALKRHNIRTTFINSLPAAARMYKNYLPLMPLALEQLDLRGYDLVISNESGPAKGVICRPGSVHVSYVQTPMRYIWNMYHDYRRESGLLTRMLMPPLAHYLRNWDVTASSRVDAFIGNSMTVADRIHRYYRREAAIVHPPVEVDDFAVLEDGKIGDYHLMVGELVRYKRPDLAVEAFNRMGRKLVVIGGGEMLSEIRRLAGATVEILGPQPFEVLKHHYSRCQALIFPGEEDFGIVPVEAMASGRPVIAYARGGATETVINLETGIFFDMQTVESLIDAVELADRTVFKPKEIAAHARKFSSHRFAIEMRSQIGRAIEQAERLRMARHPGGRTGSAGDFTLPETGAEGLRFGRRHAS